VAHRGEASIPLVGHPAGGFSARGKSVIFHASQDNCDPFLVSTIL